MRYGGIGCFGLALLFLSVTARGQGLAELYALARSGEPGYLGAVSARDAAQARTGQAFGALLPQASLSANTNTNDRDYATRGANTSSMHDRYNSNSTQLNVTQPLWRQANIAGLRQAEAAERQATHQLVGAEHDLLVKLAMAWFDVLAARDTVIFAGQQVAASRRQWEVVRRGVELGTASPPQAEEAKAKYDQALAESVAAETDSRIKKAALEQFVGPLDRMVSPTMRDDAAVANLGLDSLETWLQAVESGNPSFLAATQAFEAASQELGKQRAGHLPTLDLVATYGKNSQAVGGFPGQAGYDIKQNSLGLQLNVPIFSGGTQSAKVDEAVATKEKARHDMEAARRGAHFVAKQAWFGWHGASAKALAGVQGVRSASAALQVARRGLDTGLKAELDVLLAEQQLAAALRDLRKARYDQILSHMKLKVTAGTWADGDIAAIDRLFSAGQAASPEPGMPRGGDSRRRGESATRIGI